MAHVHASNKGKPEMRGAASRRLRRDCKMQHWGRSTNTSGSAKIEHGSERIRQSKKNEVQMRTVKKTIVTESSPASASG